MEKRLNEVMRRRHAGQRGFTLIELLVVIAVLGVLAAIVIFNVTGVANRGSAAACSTDVKSVQSAVDAWTSDNGGTAFTTGVIGGGGAAWSTLVPTYLHTQPSSCSSGFTVGASNLVTGS